MVIVYCLTKHRSVKDVVRFLNFYNTASCLSYVPEKGSVGASGDLAPLSHLALGMMGEGEMWSPESGWASAREVCCTPINADKRYQKDVAGIALSTPC